jgi:hypothetical protein
MELQRVLEIWDGQVSKLSALFRPYIFRVCPLFCHYDKFKSSEELLCPWVIASEAEHYH